VKSRRIQWQKSGDGFLYLFGYESRTVSSGSSTAEMYDTGRSPLDAFSNSSGRVELHNESLRKGKILRKLSNVVDVPWFSKTKAFDITNSSLPQQAYSSLQSKAVAIPRFDLANLFSLKTRHKPCPSATQAIRAKTASDGYHVLRTS
jgi:hypothetical protein